MRSPLTNIIGFAQLLGTETVGALNEKQRDYTSHNTQRLSVEEVAELLADLPEMRTALAKVSV